MKGRGGLPRNKILPYRSTLTSSALLHLGKENPFSLLSTFATSGYVKKNFAISLNFDFVCAAASRKRKPVFSSLDFRNFGFALIMAPWKRKFIFFSLGLRNFRIFVPRKLLKYTYKDVYHNIKGKNDSIGVYQRK